MDPNAILGDISRTEIFLIESIPLLATAIVLYILIKILNLNSRAAAPVVKCKDSKFNCEVKKSCPILHEIYQPTLLWGKSGHIQTYVYAKHGRFQKPAPRNRSRKSLVLPDKTTFTFDIFDPVANHSSKEDYTICIAPGIANCSENSYIEVFAWYGQQQGYRVVVLNHLGVLKSLKLTSPRIFTYGDTDEYAGMVEYVLKNYPSSKLIAVGFSMGANTVVKYLGEKPERQRHFECVVSVCQGYDITKASYVLHEWEGLRRLYCFMMAENLKKHIRRNSYMLFGEGAKTYRQKHSAPDVFYDVEQIYKSTSLVHIDEHLNRKMLGFDSLNDFYRWCSSSNHIHKIYIPMLMLNSEDDALIPPKYNDTPEAYIQTADKAMHVTTKHGGHLGFYEGGYIKANCVTWMERMCFQYIDAVVELNANAEL
ncbi:monoacylglycerol lipase ABHD2-like [Anneissia japonica]|uniref:monoacylglycerol lipase ABHD2-like n=1 Tax=Anneissia japonica TaxID=1529436 RepID=UPI0014259AA0|nr:monoacylglycerol lipase ABHD2-like [Anneissia japonica]XP_033099596.1 monoacylglycerol lipase ABHD2-like [Anneissia japonica]